MKRETKLPDNGFTMIVVLWVIALLTLVLSGFLRSAGTHTGIAANAVASARAEALADAGIHMGVLDLLDASQDKAAFAALSQNATLRACRAGTEGTISIMIEDAGGRVDLNAAGQSLLAALIAGLGASAAEATAGAAAIADYRDRDNEPLPGGAEAADYAAAGLPHGPKNARFDTAEELESVFGFGLERAREILPYVTVHSGTAGIDTSTAPPRLIALLKDGQRIMTGAAAGLSPPGQLSGEFASPSPRQFFILTSAAETAEGARFVRESVVGLGSGRSRDFAFRTWKRRETVTGTAPSGAAPPPCRRLTG